MTKQQRLILVVSILASTIAFLDGSIVNVALPAIQRDIGGGLAIQQWIVDAYLISLGALILIAGSLSDLLGRKRILQYGLVGFGLTSLACALAPSGEWLVAARALQGVAGALLVPSSLAIIISAFKGPAQGKAIGTWTAWTGIAFVIGPLLGGFLVDTSSWRLIFAINILPTAFTLWLLGRSAIKQELKPGVKVDTVGAILCVLGLGGPVFALIEQPQYGWANPLIYTTLISGLVLFALFLWYERKAKHPMLPFELFAIQNFTFGNLATLAIYAALSAVTLLVTLFLQQVSGFSALAAGLALMPITIIMFVLSSYVGGLSGKYGPRWFMATGPIIIGIGCLMMLRLSAQVNYWWDLLLPIVLFGIGLSVTVAPLTSAVLGDVKSEHAGIASAINNAVARVAGLLAVAAIGAFLAAQFVGALPQELARHGVDKLPADTVNVLQSQPLQLNVPSQVSSRDSQAVKDALADASVTAFRTSIVALAVLVVLGGVVSAVGIRNKHATHAKA